MPRRGLDWRLFMLVVLDRRDLLEPVASLLANRTTRRLASASRTPLPAAWCWLEFASFSCNSRRKAICSSVVSSFLGERAGMVSTGMLRSSAEHKRSSSERYELGSPNDDMHDRYGLGSQLELLLSRRIATDCAWLVVFEVLLSVRARA